MKITKDVLDEFKAITNKDVELYLSNAISFFSFSYSKMIDFYSGKTQEIDKGVFIELDILEKQTEELFATYRSFQNRLFNTKWWVLLEIVEEIDTRLQTARNINKWSKSSIAKVAYDPSLQVQYILKPNQTLERISQDVLQDINPNDDWEKIARANQIAEEDYTNRGGTQITLSLPRVSSGIAIESVVDVMVGKNIYGKDIDRHFQYDTVEEDIKVLSPDDTVLQDVLILANLKQNDNPDYPTDGLQSSVIAGTNRASLNFPIINRQMNTTFATDDSLKNFTINTIGIEGVGLFIDFTVSTRLNEVRTEKVIV
jgi:hypothetical protein